MANIIVHLGEQERNTLQQLAQRETRPPRIQAAIIIRKKPARQGVLLDKAKTQKAAFTQGLKTGGAS